MTKRDGSPSSTVTSSVVSHQYHNSRLEEKIIDNRYSEELDLKSMELIDQDMKIVASNVIRTTTVNDYLYLYV